MLKKPKFNTNPIPNTKPKTKEKTYIRNYR